jgi:hypothetical protein
MRSIQGMAIFPQSNLVISVSFFPAAYMLRRQQNEQNISPIWFQHSKPDLQAVKNRIENWEIGKVSEMKDELITDEDFCEIPNDEVSEKGIVCDGLWRQIETKLSQERSKILHNITSAMSCLFQINPQDMIDLAALDFLRPLNVLTDRAWTQPTM